MIVNQLIETINKLEGYEGDLADLSLDKAKGDAIAFVESVNWDGIPIPTVLHDDGGIDFHWRKERDFYAIGCLGSERYYYCGRKGDRTFYGDAVSLQDVLASEILSVLTEMENNNEK